MSNEQSVKRIVLNIGDKVRYCPSHGSEENGIVKSNPQNGEFVFVVYKCNNDWDNYQNYTGCATNISDLKLGWVKNKKHEIYIF